MKARIKSLIPTLFFILIIWKPGYNQSMFKRSIDSTQEISVSNIMVTDNDKKLFIISNDVNFTKSLMLKSDMNGNIIWQEESRTFSDKPILVGGMQQLDTTYLLAGTLKDTYQDAALLMHFSRSGDLLDFKGYDPFGLRWIRATMITLTDDNHVVMGGGAYQNSTPDRIMWLRTTLEGNNPKFKTFVSEKDMFPVKLIPMTNGNGEVIVATYAGDLDPTDPSHLTYPRLFRVDSAGGYIWIKDFKLSYNGTLADIIHVGDGGYIMIGNGQRKSYVFKTDANFEVQWMKSAEFPDTVSEGPFPGFYAVIEKGNHHLLIAGSQRFNTSDEYSLLAETDENGNLLQAHMDSSGNVITKMAAMSDQFTLLAGRDQLNQISFSSLDSTSGYACDMVAVVLNWYNDSLPTVTDKGFNQHQYSALAVDTLKFFRSETSFETYNGCIGNVAVPAQPVSLADQFFLYPNPTNGSILVAATLQHPESISIKVLDLTGRELYSENFGKVSGSFSKQVDLTKYSSGTYLLQIIHDGQLDVKKLEIEK